MDIIKIDGISYDVIVTELSENFNILYSENTGRVLETGATMVLDPLGTFIGHKIKFQRKHGQEKAYDYLYDYLMQPKSIGISVEIVHNQEKIIYDAYVSQGERALKKIDKLTGRAYWGEFAVNIIPMKAQVLPQ
jgi:hypothetical protein